MLDLRYFLTFVMLSALIFKTTFETYVSDLIKRITASVEQVHRHRAFPPAVNALTPKIGWFFSQNFIQMHQQQANKCSNPRLYSQSISLQCSHSNSQSQFQQHFCNRKIGFFKKKKKVKEIWLLAT